ncbi:MAG TPA: hypothetical protein VGE42_07640 [Candidatus Dormibacteraeota bacterium]
MHRERLVTHEAIGAVLVAPRGAVLPGGSGMARPVSCDDILPCR